MRVRGARFMCEGRWERKKANRSKNKGEKIRRREYAHVWVWVWAKI